MATPSPRPLKFWDLALYAVAMTWALRWIAAAAAAGPAALPLWVLAMVGFMGPLVIATAELVGRFEGDGGLYAWGRETLGPFFGFLSGWIYWTCNIPYFSGMLVFIVNVIGLAAPAPVQAALKDPLIFLMACISLSVGVAGLHLLGLGAGKWLSNFGAAAGATLLAILILTGVALAAKGASATPFAHASYLPQFSADIAILWGTMVFAFGGPEALAFLRNDVEGGLNQILKVLAVVAFILTAAYLAGTSAMLVILSPEQATRLSGLPEALMTGLGRLGLGNLAPSVLVILALSLIGGYSSWFGVAARLPFVAGVDHVLPSAFAYRSPKTGAPSVSIIVQSTAIISLVLLSQSGSGLKAAYDWLVSMSVLSYTLPFAFLFVIYLVAIERPAVAGAWSPPGGRATSRIIGWVGLAVALSAIICTLVPSPDEVDKVGATLKLVGASIILIAVGAGFYGLAHLRARSSSSSD